MLQRACVSVGLFVAGDGKELGEGASAAEARVGDARHAGQSQPGVT